MSKWTHKYEENAIPGAVQSGVITKHKPGQKIAKAITEIQDRVVAEIGNVDLINATGRIEIVDNKLNVQISVNPPEIPSQFPPGGKTGDVLTKEDTAVVWRGKYPSGGVKDQALIPIVGGSDGITGKWGYLRAIVELEALFFAGSNILQIKGKSRTSENSGAPIHEFETQIQIPTVQGPPGPTGPTGPRGPPATVSGSFSVVTDIRYDSGSRTFQRRTGTVSIVNNTFAITDNGWSDVLTLAEFSC